MTPAPTSWRGVRRARWKRAFTLIEMLMVVAILGIAAAMIVPAVSTNEDLQVAAASRVVLGDLLYAQNRAIALQKTHYIEFNGNSYTLYARDSATSAPYVINNPVTNAPYTTAFGAAGPASFANIAIGTENFGSGSTSLSYDDMGSPWAYNAQADTATAMTQSGSIVLQTTSGTFPVTVTIQPYTGEAIAQ
jgi:prepilin-type N-terminal cleavage/methylation domain-containing protein